MPRNRNGYKSKSLIDDYNDGNSRMKASRVFGVSAPKNAKTGVVLEEERKRDIENWKMINVNLFLSLSLRDC